MESNEIETTQGKTLVGISADGSEDWSREFLLDEEIPLAILKSMSSESKSYEINFGDSVDNNDEEWNVEIVNINEKVEEPIDENEEDEDWDMELGIAEEVKEAQDYLADGLRLVMNDVISVDQIRGIDDSTFPDPSALESQPITIPARCKLARSLLNASGSVNVVLFPKPPSLYSLKLDRARKQYSAVEFDDWLQTIVSKHQSRVYAASQGKDQHWLSQVRLKEKKLSLKLTTSWSQYLQILWRNREIEQLFQSLTLLKQYLNQNLIPDKNQRSYSEDESQELYESLCHILRISLFISIDRSISIHRSSSRNSQSSTKSPGKSMTRINFQFHILLTEQTASPPTSYSQKSKTNSQPCCQLFHDILLHFTTIYPVFKERLALFELQCASYFLTMMLGYNLDLFWSPKPVILLQYYVKLYQKLMLQEKRSKSTKTLLSSPSSMNESDFKYLGLIKIEILSDMYLFLNGYIPLLIQPNRHLQNFISELSHSSTDLQGSYHEDDQEEGVAEGDESGDDESCDVVNGNELICEAESSDMESHSGRSNSQEISNESNLTWAGTNLSWLQSNPTEGRKTLSMSSCVDGDDSSVGESVPLPPRRLPTSDSIDSFRVYKEDNISKLASNRSSISIVSNVNDNMTITSNSPFSSILEEILSEEEEISLEVLLHFFCQEINNFHNILKLKYPYISRRFLLKSKVLFIITLINLQQFPDSKNNETIKSTHTDFLESLFFECLMLLDRQSKETFNSIIPSITTPFGMVVLEKFADTLIKSAKFKFASSCLESMLCYHSMNVKNSNLNEIKLLYRRLISVSQLSGDHKKSLYYYSKILKIAKKENKLNEFVYMSELMSKILLEFGEYLLAERCMSVVCLLHFGTPLVSIDFEYIDITKFEHSELPQGIELPKILFSSPVPSNGSNSSGTTPWNRLTSSSISPNSVPRNVLNSSLTCDSQQLSAVLKLVELFMFSNQYEYARDYCLSLLKRKLFPQGRSQVLTQLAICYLKLRRLEYCEATLDRIAFEADEIVSSLFVKKHTGHLSEGSHSILPEMLAGSPRKFPTARYHRPSTDNFGKHSSIKNLPPIKDHGRSSSDAPVIVSASALTYVSKVKSYSYLYLRAKCRYYANDPEWAIHWLQIALAVCPKGKWDWRAKIRCLMGKSFVKLCLRSRNCSQLSVDPSGNPKQPVVEGSFALSAEEEFLNAIALYKKNSDILKQIKCRNKIIELQVSRLFYAVTVEGLNVTAACDQKGELILRSVENLCRTNLQQLGDTSSPLELIRTLLYCSEISWLQENHPLSTSAWTEARNLLTITYLQHINSNNKQQQKSNSKLFHPSYIVSDPVNPLNDIPVLAVPFSIGMLTKLYNILSNMIRIGFFIDPSPLNQNGSTLIGAWLRLNNLIKENVTPLFSDNQFLKRSLGSYTKVFNSSSPSMKSPRSEPDEDHRKTPPISLVEEIPLQLVNLTPMDLPLDQLKPLLTRPTISSFSRRSKTSSKSSNSLHDSIEYILKDQPDVPEILRQLSSRMSQDDSEQPRRKILRSGSDVAISDAVDSVVLEVVTATSNVLLPFEMVRKAMSLEAHCDHASREGLRAVDIILQYLRLAGKNALFSSLGDDAKNILSRAAAPGITMTADGYFVPGVLDNSSAESLAKTMLETNVLQDTPLELTDLLKKTILKSDHNLSGKLLTFRRHTDRLMNLFILLKVSSIQYTEGRLSLTDLFKKNTDILRKIALSTRGNYDSPRSAILKSSVPQSPLDDALVSNHDSNDSDNALDDTSPKPLHSPQAGLAHSASFTDFLSTEISNPSSFPLSFRFVLLIENYLFLYVPVEGETSVMILRDKIKALKLVAPHSLTQSMSKDRLSDCETVSNVSNTTNNSLIETRKSEDEGNHFDSKRSFVSLKYSSKKSLTHSDSIKGKKRSMLSRRKSGFHTLNSESSNTLSSAGAPDGKEEFFFALSSLEGRQSITDVQSLIYQPADQTVSDALRSLPLPRDEAMIDLRDKDLKESDDKLKIKVDHSIAASLRLLGLQNLLFLLTALMMEESLLVVGPPGFEQNIFHICTALLRLLRPLCWQHLYIPLMQSTMQTVFKSSLKSREPFLIGTYYEVVDGVHELLSTYMKNCQNNYLNSAHGGYLSDVVIVDGKTGYVKPSRRMRFAATCSLSSIGGVVPEADPIHLKILLDRLEAEKRNSALALKPPLPARYRFEIYLKLSRNASGDDIRFLTYLPQNGESTTVIREGKLLKWSIRLQECVKSVMLSLFKDLSATVANSLESRQTHRRRHSGSDFSKISQSDFEQDQYLLGIKDDVKPFIQYLFYTRSFKKFVEEITDYKTIINQLNRGETDFQPLVYPSLHQHLAVSELLLSNRREIYSSLSVERLGGFMTTYFLTLPDPGQPYPFFYTFPYGYDDMLKNKQRKGSLKVKRRWCVLDAQTLTYYKSRSQRLIKDHIRIDPSSVRLLTSPYCQPLLIPANNLPQPYLQYSNPALALDYHRCALEYGENQVLVFRMDTLEEHNRWIRALKARLFRRDENP